jgi:hypothetical protein
VAAGRPRINTSAPSDVVAVNARAYHLPYDFTLPGIPLFREAKTHHILVYAASAAAPMSAPMAAPAAM